MKSIPATRKKRTIPVISREKMLPVLDSKYYRDVLRKMLITGSIGEIIDAAADDSVIAGLVLDQKHKQIHDDFQRSHKALFAIADRLPDEDSKAIRHHAVRMEDFCIRLYTHAAEEMFDLMADFFIRGNSPNPVSELSMRIRQLKGRTR